MAATARQRLIRALCAFLATLTAAHAGSLEKGLEFYQRGEYADAGVALARAARGAPEQAAFLVGYMHAAGLGRARNDLEARSWFLRGAAVQDPRCQFNLGLFAAQGRAGRRSDREARDWFRKAAEQGNQRAQFTLGLFLEQGRGGPEDPTQAAVWYFRAATLGMAQAQYNLAMLYLTGRGVDLNPERAAEWLERAADKGLARAQYDYAVLQTRGLGTLKDLPAARLRFQEAASADDDPDSARMARSALRRLDARLP